MFAPSTLRIHVSFDGVSLSTYDSLLRILCGGSLLTGDMGVGIKEVVTLTSDLSRKNLEKDFERMDTPQGTFYRMFSLPPVLSSHPNPRVYLLHSRLCYLMPKQRKQSNSILHLSRCILRHPPRPRRIRVQRRTGLSRRSHGQMYREVQIDG